MPHENPIKTKVHLAPDTFHRLRRHRHGDRSQRRGSRAGASRASRASRAVQSRAERQHEAGGKKEGLGLVEEMGWTSKKMRWDGYWSISQVYIYIYTRCSVEGPHSQSNVAATLHSIGKINKGTREYKPPAFNWEDRQRYKGILNSHPPLNFYIHWRSSKRVWWWWWRWWWWWWWCVACRGCVSGQSPGICRYIYIYIERYYIQWVSLIFCG